MKYGMLIVDDEYLVRMGIRETLDWSKIKVEIIGEASNGRQGLEAALRFNPDLIFTDIKMPVMDGLEMIEKLAEANYDGAIIIYSGYQDFEYARKALEYGVVTYLLKPFNNEEILKKVEEALEKLEEKRLKTKIVSQFERNLPIVKAKLFQDLLNGQLGVEQQEQLKLYHLVPPSKGVIISAKGSGENEEELRDDLDLMQAKILNLLQDYQSIYQNLDQDFVILTSLCDISFMANEINKFLINHQRRSENTLSIQISSVYGEGISIPDAYEETRSLFRNKLFVAVNTVATSNFSNHPYKQLVKDVMKIISEEYNNKLSVKMVAKRLYVSESHLMHEFKENVGKTFNECLTEYRIMKAKELLLKGRYRINEVASLVGYNDVKYFGQVFKDMVGVTPSQFLLELNDEA